MDDFGILPFGHNVPNPYRSTRHDHTSMADGDKGTRLDMLIDDDGPVGANKKPDAADEANLRARKQFRVTENSGLGGTGLWHGKE